MSFVNSGITSVETKNAGDKAKSERRADSLEALVSSLLLNNS